MGIFQGIIKDKALFEVKGELVKYLLETQVELAGAMDRAEEPSPEPDPVPPSSSLEEAAARVAAKRQALQDASNPKRVKA